MAEMASCPYARTKSHMTNPPYDQATNVGRSSWHWSITAAMSDAQSRGCWYWSASNGWSDMPWPRRSRATRRNSSASSLATWSFQHRWLPDHPWIIRTGGPSRRPHSRTWRRLPAPPMTVVIVDSAGSCLLRRGHVLAFLPWFADGPRALDQPAATDLAGELSRALPRVYRGPMEFRLLGALEVAARRRARSGSPARCNDASSPSLLVQARTVVSADRLVDVLWGSQAPVDARQSLWTNVARLRRALAGPQTGRGRLLLTRPPGYLLDVEPEQVDAGRFEALAAAGTTSRSRIRAARARCWTGRSGCGAVPRCRSSPRSRSPPPRRHDWRSYGWP